MIDLATLEQMAATPAAILLGAALLEAILPWPAQFRLSALVPLLTQWQPKQLGVYAVYGTRKQMSPLLRSFLDFLIERMADAPLWQAR